MSRSPLSLAVLVVALVAAVATSPATEEPVDSDGVEIEPFQLELAQEARFAVTVRLAGEDLGDHGIDLSLGGAAFAPGEAAVVNAAFVWEGQSAAYEANFAVTDVDTGLSLSLPFLAESCVEDPMDIDRPAGARRDGDCVIELEAVVTVLGGGSIEADVGFTATVWPNDEDEDDCDIAVELGVDRL